MNIFAWIIFGIVTGVVANLFDPHPSSGGLIGSIILGISGALVGGLLSAFIFSLSIIGFNLESFVVAVLGASLALFLARSLIRASHG